LIQLSNEVLEISVPEYGEETSNYSCQTKWEREITVPEEQINVKEEICPATVNLYSLQVINTCNVESEQKTSNYRN
jgi:hypothetical protein